MLVALCGQWGEDCGELLHEFGLTTKDANEIINNILLSANIYGKSRHRQNVAFTIPILYFKPKIYNHARIYFQFKIINPNFLKLKFPMFFFFTYPSFSEKVLNVTLLRYDTVIWNYLQSPRIQEKEKFDQVLSDIQKIITDTAF